MIVMSHESETMSHESETLPGNQAIAQQRFNQAIELEKQLRSLIESKGPLGLNVRDIRLKIRETYENIILEDHEFAEGHEVEQALWRLHYKQIEQFRNRTSGTAGGKHLTRNEPAHKFFASFKSFLSEATGFYHELILKLRAKHGLSPDFFSTEGVCCPNNQNNAADFKRCQLSCHRCLIYLGDLARYKELHGDGDSPNHDWSVAAGYYLKAVSLWPANGNPHNQLAVLSTYLGDELLAVYRYFRCLAVETPFATARDNLIILFEKNRLHYFQRFPYANESISPASQGMESSKTKGDKTFTIGDGLTLALKDHKQHGAGVDGNSISELRNNFRVRFVRLSGILFTKTSLETFPDVYAATIRDLEQLLAFDDMDLEAGLGSEHRSGIGTGSGGAAGVLQLVCILIFTVHNANGSNTIHQPTYAEVLQRTSLLQNAVSAAFECVGRLMRRCADSNDVSISPFLPAMLVFTEWLACRKEISVVSEIDEKQANARCFFWMQCVGLLNKLNGSKLLEADAASSTVDALEMPSDITIPLWEDYELEGFGPLIPAQRQLDFSISPVRVGLRNRKEQKVRVQRLLAAGKAIGITFEGTGRGIAYNEVTRRFYLPGELNGRNKNDASSTDEQAVPKQMINYHENNSVAPNSGPIDGHKERKITTKEVFSKSVNVDEDDGEYIVFKPVPKDVSAMNTACMSSRKEFGEVSSIGPNVAVSNASSFFHGKIVPDKLETSSINNDHLLGSVSHGPIRFPACSFRDFLPNVAIQGEGDHRAFDCAVPLSQALGAFPSATSSAMPLFVHTPVTAVQFSSVHQGELQLNMQTSTGEEFSAFPSPTLSSWDVRNYDLMFTAGIGKPNAPGVIGQQKQVDMSLSYWNTQVDVPSLARLSGLSMNDPSAPQPASEKYAIPSNLMGQTSQSDRVQHSGIPSSFHTEYPFSAMRPYPSAPLLPEEIEVNLPGDITFGKEAKETNSATTTPLEYSGARKYFLKTSIPAVQSITKEYPSASWMGPSAIGPPPGFGPSQFISGRSDEDGDAPLQVDDYAWLDGYISPSISESNSERYRDWGISKHSSENGMRTSGDKLTVSTDSAGFPFPGMGFSGYHHADDQQMKQMLDLQFYEQLLQNHQNKWFDYGMESKPLQYGNLQSLYEAQQQSESQEQSFLLQERQEELYRQYHMGRPFAS